MHFYCLGFKKILALKVALHQALQSECNKIQTKSGSLWVCTKVAAFGLCLVAPLALEGRVFDISPLKGRSLPKSGTPFERYVSNHDYKCKMCVKVIDSDERSTLMVYQCLVWVSLFC